MCTQMRKRLDEMRVRERKNFDIYTRHAKITVKNAQGKRRKGEKIKVKVHKESPGQGQTRKRQTGRGR